MSCECNSTRHSIKWFWLLNEILQASVTIPLTGTVLLSLWVEHSSVHCYIFYAVIEKPFVDSPREEVMIDSKIEGIMTYIETTG